MSFAFASNLKNTVFYCLQGNAGMCAYSSSKAAVIGLVKSTGKEYAETGITVNGLAPAVVRTAMVEAMKPEQVKYMTDKIPKKRLVTIIHSSTIPSHDEVYRINENPK